MNLRAFAASSLLLALAPIALRADSAAAGLSATAAAVPAAPTATGRPAAAGIAPPGAPSPISAAPLDPFQWSQTGLEYRFSLGMLKLPNGQALSYIPLELGWRFINGWDVRFGLEAFYYTGLDGDSTTGGAPTLFYYQMEDFRLSALYLWRRGKRWRPLAGVTVESVFGSRQISEPNPAFTNPPTESAHGFEAPGAEAGLEYRGGPSWALSLEARYVVGLGYWANMVGTDFGWHYLF